MDDQLFVLEMQGAHCHARLEGGSQTKKVESHPTALVRQIVKAVGILKQMANAKYPKDPVGKIPRQCAYCASEGGCQKGEKCLYLHEMEGGRPKPACPEDVAKLEARAKANPALRPPSKPPVKATMPTSTPIAKMLPVQGHAFDFAIYYDFQEGHDSEVEDVFYDCREPLEKRHPISDTGDISPFIRTSPCLHMWRTMRTMHVPLSKVINMQIGSDVHYVVILMQLLPTLPHVVLHASKDTT